MAALKHYSQVRHLPLKVRRLSLLFFFTSPLEDIYDICIALSVVFFLGFFPRSLTDVLDDEFLDLIRVQRDADVDFLPLSLLLNPSFHDTHVCRNKLLTKRGLTLGSLVPFVLPPD